MKLNIRTILVSFIVISGIFSISSCDKLGKEPIAGAYYGKITIPGTETPESSPVVVAGPVLGKGVITLIDFPLLSGQDLIIPLVNITNTTSGYSIDFTGNLLPGIDAQVTGTSDGFNMNMTININVTGVPMVVAFSGRKMAED
ncbi:MAG: hypothetical protein ACD_77C00318G0004 [uncultured bacterium]|nr:MAG: hypothetical protein ACD_77C00318G0004 [uncultured bacterium]HBY02857.1 hypothetical protein [Rikenellaceae bacterium]